MNMTAVFIHLLGDFLGSLSVIISAIVLINFDSKTHAWVRYVDPFTSTLLATVILIGTIPLIKKCVSILLQSAPESVDVVHLKFELMEIDGVLDIKNMHVWQLSGAKYVCTATVVCKEQEDFVQLLSRVKATLHSHGIDHSSIEPFHVSSNDDKNRTELLHDVDDDDHQHHRSNNLLSFDGV
jgi:zinc transporter 1